jgi:hypothetical protein
MNIIVTTAVTATTFGGANRAIKTAITRKKSIDLTFTAPPYVRNTIRVQILRANIVKKTAIPYPGPWY